MLIEAVERVIQYRLRTGEEIQLRPGVPTDVPDHAARQLLKKAAGQVRVVEAPRAVETVIEPAAPTARPIYFEDASGRILGPATPECLARAGDDFWIVTTVEGCVRWIRSDRLRSRRVYEAQPPVERVEVIRAADLIPLTPEKVTKGQKVKCSSRTLS